MFSTPFPLGIFREGLGSGGGIGGLAGFILVVMGRVRLGPGGVLVLMDDWMRGGRVRAGPPPGNPPGRGEKTPKESGTFGV